MKNEIKELYRQFRKSGGNPKQALWSAKTLHEFQTYETEYEDFVRIRAVYNHESYFDVYGEPEGYTDLFGRYHSSEQAKQETIDLIERDGIWTVISEVNTSDNENDPQWEFVDSVSMCVATDPTDPFDNYYVPDLMHAANKICRDILIDKSYAELLEM